MEQFNASQPTPAEINTTFSRVITDVRKMISEGRLRMEKIDAKLVVEEGIEEALRKPRPTAGSSSSSVSQSDSSKIQYEANAEFHTPYPEMAPGAASGTANVPNGAGNSDTILLKKRLTVLSNENSVLKQEVLRLRGKLDQIKKIA